MYKLLLLKRRIEALAIFPFALLGRLIGRMRPLGEEYDLFLFFPFYHVGGAERYTRKSRNCSRRKRSSSSSQRNPRAMRF